MKIETQSLTQRSALAILICSALSGPLAHAEGKEIRIFAASTVYTNILSKIESQFEKKTGFKLKYVNDVKKSSNALDNLKTVLDNTAEAGVTSIPFDDWMDLAKKKKLPVEGANLTHRTIGKDVVEIISHPGVGTKKLKLADVGRLFSGEAKNWNQVGGKDIPVVPIYQKKSIARVTVFQKAVMPGKAFSKDILDFENYTDLVRKVANTPGAISFLATEQIAGNGNVQNIDTDEEVMRPITLICKGRPSEGLFKLVEFIRGEGQEIMKKSQSK